MVDGELVASLAAYLGDSSNARPAAGFPANARDAHLAGLYSWWADAEGCSALSVPFGQEIGPLIYAGQAGATTKRSGVERAATLGSRIGGNHLGGNVKSSTFRKTLTAVLIGPLDLHLAGPNKLESTSNQALTGWMHSHLSVATIGVADRAALAAAEESVLQILDPPLNLMGMAQTPVRAELRRLRALLGADQAPPTPTTRSAYRSAMGLSQLTERRAVLAAIAEFDEIGRDAFLRRYGFGRARGYFLVYEGKQYDSKAIAGVAYGKQFPELGPLRSSEFSGGASTVYRTLLALGFEVRSP